VRRVRREQDQERETHRAACCSHRAGRTARDFGDLDRAERQLLANRDIAAATPVPRYGSAVSWWTRLFERPAVAAEVELPTAPIVVARDPAQEAAIAHALETGDASDELAVYGDWLAGQGDPRGALITLHGKLEPPAGEWARFHHPRTIDPLQTSIGWFAGEAAVLIDRHRRHFLGAQPQNKKHESDAQNVEWHAGFWRRLRWRPLDDDRARRAELAALLVHPSAAFLRGLWIGTTWGVPLAEALPDQLPRTLRELYLGDFEFPDESELSWTIVGAVAPLYPRLRDLERLVLQGLGAELGPRIELPRLRSLEIITTQLERSAAEAIAASPPPALESLSLWVGEDREQGVSARDAVIAMLRAPLPRLRHLGIRNCAETDAIVEALIDTPLFAQLHTLDLSLGTLSSYGARLLLGARARSQLTALDISDNLVDEDAVRELHALATIIGEEAQRGADHFVPITE
jgi:hypothetical protein